jgi:hypothetical protein
LRQIRASSTGSPEADRNLGLTFGQIKMTIADQKPRPNVRKLPLVECKDLLMVLVMGAGYSRLRLSDGFADGAELLAAAERMGLEVRGLEAS